MYGGSAKLGRGGGGGGGGGTAAKRNIHAPPVNRAAGRPSMGGAAPRGRGGATATSSPSAQAVEESFSLVRENPLNFGMAIKLAPDLVEEIRRAEAHGGTARIKFDVNANNPLGNVIHVGDKVFKFTWSREPGDLCDIYEERQSGEDGNGLLVESGGTWRKLNVERELDESTKNHVKKRSEEAERKHKSRKAIILDHQNPSMKNQVKAIAAAESNQWRNYNRKEPPFKKAKFEPSSGGPSKSAYKTGLPTNPLSKGKISSASPMSSQPDQHGGPTSPGGSGNFVKGHGEITDVAPTQNSNYIASSDREMTSRLPSNIMRDKSNHNRNMEAKPADLRSLMISLLLEHQSKGMSLKALEKAIGDAMPNSARQIEPILKQIAIFRSPGRYFLKPGVEKEGFKKPPSQSGSSPEINRHQSPLPQKFDQQLPVQDPSFSMRTPVNGEEHGELNSTPLRTANPIEKIDILQNSPQQYSDKKVSDNSDGDSDSGSDSDSDSDSSDSGSDSGSHSKSKSRSPAGSSSDTESDASISSKQASDEEVDIMSDDDKDNESKHKLLDSEPVLPKFPVQWSHHQDDESVDVGNYEKQDDYVSEVIEIEKDTPENDRDAERPVADYLFSNKEREEYVEEIRPSSGYDEPGSVANERFSKEKSKRHREDNERTQNRKKLKSKNSTQPTIESLFGDSPDQLSPDRPLQGPDKEPLNVMVERTNKDGDNDPYSQTEGNQVRAFEARVRSDAPSGDKRPGKHDSLDRGVKYSERNFQTNEGHRNQKGLNTQAQSENGLVSERRPAKFSTENVGDKHGTAESHYRKPEIPGKVKEAGPLSNSNMGFSPKEANVSTTDRLPVTNGRGAVLRREHSDLELGEFREPFHDVTPLPKKQFEKKNSFKQVENKPMDSDWNSDLSRGKPPNKISSDLGKSSPLNFDGILDGPSKRKASEHYVDDLTRSHQKSRFADTGTGRRPSVEAYGDTLRKMPVNSTEQKQNDPIRVVGPHTAKESKKQKPNMVGDPNGRRIDASSTGTTDSGQKKKESSSDEDICLYTKYEKEEPELKGPIKDDSEYNEYVKEYQEKYESYCSLDKILEAYRDEFGKYGKDLEAYKDRDMKRYHETLEQMRSSFRQCAERHKRQKKIFIVLHEELKHLKQMIKDYAASYRRD